MASQGALARWTAPAGAWTEPDLHLFPQDGHLGADGAYSAERRVEGDEPVRLSVPFPVRVAASTWCDP